MKRSGTPPQSDVQRAAAAVQVRRMRNPVATTAAATRAAEVTAVQVMYLVLFTGHRNTEKGSPSWFEELLVAPGEHGGNANESARAT